jgi:hypothetical protein
MLGKSQRLSGPAGAEIRSTSEANGSGTSVGVLAKGDAHPCVAVVDDVGREGDDPDQRPGVEQQERAGEAVGE